MTQTPGAMNPERQAMLFFGTTEFLDAYNLHSEADTARLTARQQLFDNLAQGFGSDPIISQDDVIAIVEDYIGLSDEAFEDHMSDEAVGLRRDLRTAEDNLTAARKGVIEAARTFELSQFAVYGINSCLKYRLASNKEELRQLTMETQEDFLKLDRLIRVSEGRLLTVTNFGGVSAGILGEGGLSFVKDEVVAIPRAENTKCYAMTFVKEQSRLFSYPDYITVSPTDIHALNGQAANVFNGWAGLLTIPPGRRTANFAVGDVSEGTPAFLANNDDPETARFYKLMYERIRFVGRAATESAQA